MPKNILTLFCVLYLMENAADHEPVTVLELDSREEESVVDVMEEECKPGCPFSFHAVIRLLGDLLPPLDRVIQPPTPPS